MKKQPNILLQIFKTLEIISRATFTIIGLGILFGFVLILVTSIIGLSHYSTNKQYNNSARTYNIDIEQDTSQKQFSRVDKPNVVIFDPIGLIKETFISNKTSLSNTISQRAFEELNLETQDQNIIPLFRIQGILETIANDPNITAIVLDYRNISFENDLVKEKITKQLQKIQKSGKKIISYATINFHSYMVSSVADAFIIDDLEPHMLTGYSTREFLYYKNLLDKFKIGVHTARAGKYKSAVEGPMRLNMSPEAEENIKNVYSDFWNRYLSYASQNRKIKPQVITAYINNYDKIYENYAGNIAKAAVDMRLATHIYSGGTELTFISKVIESTTNLESKNIYFENFTDYAKRNKKELQLQDNNKNYNIVVVPLTGILTYGESTQDTIGIDSIMPLIENLKNNTRMKSLVLRINSPGGSVEVSKRIRRELLILKNKYSIPIIVSMGELTASGGYFISTAADYIVSEPFTITGSIGVYFQYYTFENALERFGINTDSYQTTWLDNSLSPLQDPSLRIQNFLQLSVDTEYKQFIQHVSKARNMSIQQVKNIAEGRIYTGTQAKQINLVDKIGYLDDAIQIAAQKANIKLEDIQVHYISPKIEYNLSSNILHNISIYVKSQIKDTIKTFFLNFNNTNSQIKM